MAVAGAEGAVAGDAAVAVVEVALGVEVAEAVVDAPVFGPRGLRRLRGVRWMCTSLVGGRAAASNVFLSAAGSATIDTIKAAAQRRRRAGRNTARQ